MLKRLVMNNFDSRPRGKFVVTFVKPHHHPWNLSVIVIISVAQRSVVVKSSLGLGLNDLLMHFFSPRKTFYLLCRYNAIKRIQLRVLGTRLFKRDWMLKLLVCCLWVKDPFLRFITVTCVYNMLLNLLVLCYESLHMWTIYTAVGVCSNETKWCML